MDDQAAAVLTSPESALLLGGAGTGERGLRAASRICAASGARMLGQMFPARQARGAGVPPLGRLAYLAEAAGTRTGGVSAPAPETRWQLLRRHPRTAPVVRA